MKVVSVVGARPNFVKLASVHAAFRARGIAHAVIHTGQHYDEAMSREIFDDLGLLPPEVNLEIGPGRSHEQVARILDRLPPVLESMAPDWCIVYGDVTSTAGSALAANALRIKLAHVESGFRSFDRSMPEEVNRILVDHVADLCLAPHEIAGRQLIAEGIPSRRIAVTGSTSLDHLAALVRNLPAAGSGAPLAVVTLHRQGNVDDPDRLRIIMGEIGRLAARLPVCFPMHPRTRKVVEDLGIVSPPGLEIRPPMRYNAFLDLVRRASLLATDSGGLQEEAAFLGIPAVILRDTTERPYLVDAGLCRLIGDDLVRLVPECERLLAAPRPEPYRDEWTDGKAGERVVEALLSWKC